MELQMVTSIRGGDLSVPKVILARSLEQQTR